MEYVWMIVWVLAIALEVYLSWRRIEVDNVSPKHWVWFIPRLLIGFWLLLMIGAYGYYWYWTGLFLIGTHALLFPEGLNKARKKDWGYLGDPDLSNPKKSLYDKVLLWISDSGAFQMMWLGFRVILFIFSVANMIVQGKMSWFELNHLYMFTN